MTSMVYDEVRESRNDFLKFPLYHQARGPLCNDNTARTCEVNLGLKLFPMLRSQATRMCQFGSAFTCEQVFSILK